LLPCQLNVAVDGPAGAGKSTVARRVAEKQGLIYLDTGAMYRAVTHLAIEAGVDLQDETALTEIALQAQFSFGEVNGTRALLLNEQPLSEAIRSDQVTQAVSLVSGYPRVREAIVAQQRKLCQGKGVIMDGRDIGTVVMPDADLKIYLTASLEERARRRLRQQSRCDAELPTLIRAIERRDLLDSTREHSPLRVADDAIVLDTTDLSLEEVVERIVGYMRRVCVGRQEE
jgi:cytidylate kinase